MTPVRGPRQAFVGLWLAVLMLCACAGHAGVIEMPRGERQVSDAASPPAGESGWTGVALPDAARGSAPGGPGTAWYRASFDLDRLPPRELWALYLPFLYEGGDVWINGEWVGHVQEGSDALEVRWERPHLISFGSDRLRQGRNEWAVRAAATPDRTVRRFPPVSIGPYAELLPRHDRRMFWVRTVPQFTVVVCLAMAAGVLFIWWRRRDEVLYGLFGLAAACWGVRTLTFVIERLSPTDWQAWRVVYLGATGGFVVVLALFAMRFTGLQARWAQYALLGYWFVGPAWLAVAGPESEAVVNRWWTAGLIPIGLLIMAISLRGIVRERTWASAILPAALIVAVATGIHDYLLSWDAGSVTPWMPQWFGQRIFLLHHGANLLLLCMGGLLVARFIHTTDALEELNATLESRVADRERRLASNFEQMAQLQRQHAAAQERQQIMREIHDGLGSRLFTSLSRVERGDMTPLQIAGLLRECIADMRIALDALAPDSPSFRIALGNFLFRWRKQLIEARIQVSWSIDLPDDEPVLTPQSSLQLLRIAQEALTNVLKHSKASKVHVHLREAPPGLVLEIEDDGHGWPQGSTHDAPRDLDSLAGFELPRGRGIGNMQARARQLGAQLSLHSGPDGTRVCLQVPFAVHLA